MELRIATCRPLPEPDPDEELLLDALHHAGVVARMAAWNDPRESWDLPVPTIIRSTWDYVDDVDGFLRWVERVAAAGPLWNEPAVIVKNLHKRYLLDLSARGIPTTPTVLVSRGEPCDLVRLCDDRGWSDVVVKPAIGAASYGTRRFREQEFAEGQRHLEGLLLGGDALLQPYLRSVDGHGERALVWIDGQFTHAVRKDPRFSGGEERVSEAVPMEPDELDLGTRALSSAGADLLYARVDIARDDGGAARVMELELVEPSLFLLQSEPALDRLVRAIVVRLDAAR